MRIEGSPATMRPAAAEPPRCSVDGAAYAVCTSPFTTSVLVPGVHSVQVRATDLAGNVSAATARTFTITAPVVPPMTMPPAPKPFVLVGAVPLRTTIATLVRVGVVTPVTVNQAATVTSRLAIPVSVAKRLGLLPKTSRRTAPVVIGTTTKKVTQRGKFIVASKLTGTAARAIAGAKSVVITQTITVKTAGGIKTAKRVVTIRKR